MAKVTLIDENREVQEVRDQAKQIDEILRGFAKSTRCSWVQLGRAAHLAEKIQCWQYLTDEDGTPYANRDSYFNCIFEESRATVYRAYGLVKVENLGRLPDEVLKEIPLGNAIQLCRLGEKSRISSVWIGRAQKMKFKEFSKLVDDNLPGVAKGERKATIQFKDCPASLVTLVERALRVGMFIAESDSEKDGLECIMSAFLDAPCEIEVFAKKSLSNLEAFQQRNKKEFAR